VLALLFTGLPEVGAHLSVRYMKQVQCQLWKAVIYLKYMSYFLAEVVFCRLCRRVYPPVRQSLPG